MTAGRFPAALALLACALFAPRASAQQPIDSVYSAQIRELTPTDPHWKFTTELVSTLPASAAVPTPLKVLGYVPGTLGHLSYVADLNRYFDALAAAAPNRVKKFSLGKSEEGRESIVVAISDEANIAKLEQNRLALGQLADPRGLAPADRARLIKETKPIYWLSGSIHSPETGSPEMLMELAYRLAVDESDFVKDIRANLITLITPVTEVDGRDREVDVVKESRALKLGNNAIPLIYWGKYTAHDNNRDGMVMSQNLTKNFLRGFLYWHPTVAHDLHESVPFLYTSTGTGPYNDEYDPIVVDEWHTLAYQEITELTRRGLPGVWTHGFYDGWAPNYTLLAVANLHNSIGRFYETYTSSGAGCTTVRLPAADTSRRWDRANPPVNGIKWCIRSNINYQESGALIALKYTADHRATFLDNFVSKGERMIERGRTSAPYAFVIPRNQRHAAEAADLVNLFRAQGTEVNVATSDFTLRGSAAPPKRSSADSAATARIAKDSAVQVHAGDWIIRLDQPYAATARTLLAIQRFKADDPPPYDDTGWTLDELRHVQTLKISDSTILSKPMQMLTTDAHVEGDVSGSPGRLVVRHLGDWRSAVLPWKVAPAAVSVAEEPFTVGGASYAAGTYIINNPTDATRKVVKSLGMNGVAAGGTVTARQHSIRVPRIALMHSWLETQNEGWVRYAFDQIGVRYIYISDQSLRRPGMLDKFDVVVFPHVNGSASALVNGRPMVGPPIPWKKSALTPNLDLWDQTDDIRPGMGLEGAAALRHFVERGGLLLTTGNSSILPITLGFNPTVSQAITTHLNARGSVIRVQPAPGSALSPILYGYESPSFPIYFSQAPIFNVQPRDTIPVEGRDPAISQQQERMRAHVILRFHDKADSLLVSGLLAGGDELTGKAAVVDAPVGSGHIVMFGIRPLWRWESQGSFALALNAIANWEHLGF
ncbi:MAG TPA: M14 family zinc carboxypeptidase [Gemmatimonadaceae bacterium]|nr:M14 family zinc carboxypeptidase [Gemmatimonadaceae bacterium]